MSAALKCIGCPVSQLDLLEPIGVQAQVDGYKDIEYLPTSSVQDGPQLHLKLEKMNVIQIASLGGKQFTDGTSAGTLEKLV